MTGMILNHNDRQGSCSMILIIFKEDYLILQVIITTKRTMSWCLSNAFIPLAGALTLILSISLVWYLLYSNKLHFNQKSFPLHVQTENS